jgi:signal transduction histidine kinase
MLDLIATQAAHALFSLEGSARRVREARLRERRRMADALHDSLCQHLYMIGLHANWIHEHAKSEDEAQRRLAAIRHLASECSYRLRHAMLSLQSSDLPDGTGLIRLLKEQVNAIGTEAGLATTVLAPESLPALDPATGEAIVRIVQESVINVSKHARATAVVVSVTVDMCCEHITVAVQDDGLGLAPDSLDLADGEYVEHCGLRIMREAAAELGGDLQIGPNEGAGTIVRCRLPLALGAAT